MTDILTRHRFKDVLSCPDSSPGSCPSRPHGYRNTCDSFPVKNDTGVAKKTICLGIGDTCDSFEWICDTGVTEG